MSINHDNLPAVKTAALPAKYECAKVAIREASQVDECKDWADKAAALASYARQSQDEEMEKTAMRIRARAIRRCGELLREIEKQRGGDRRSKGREVPFDRKTAAHEAGLSPDQAKDAIRVARVPSEHFEAQVESATPPTITLLAEQGKKPAKIVPFYEELGMTKEAFQAGIHFRGAIDRFLEAQAKYSPQLVADGCTPKERKEVAGKLKEIERYQMQLSKLL